MSIPASELKSFRHIAPPLRLFSGPESLDSLGRELKRANCQRAVIVCGSSLAHEGALLELVRSAMGDRCAGVFAGVRAHSPVAAVEAAAQELKRLDADAIVALGGGSAIVTARAASILIAEDDDLRHLCTSRDAQGELRSPMLKAPKLPHFIVPTTPTTASVKAGSAVFDPESQERLALFDPKTRAHAVFVHPDLVSSAPVDLVVSASLNTLTMAIEGLTSPTGDPLADAQLMHALRLLIEHLDDPNLAESADARTQLVLAAILCGQGTDYTGAGVTTVLGHAIGARCHTENGITNAIVLPHALDFNADAIEPGLAKVASALGLHTPEGGQTVPMLVNLIGALFDQLGIPRRLRDIEVPREALADIATSGLGDWFLRGNPRPVRDVSELQQILEEAW